MRREVVRGHHLPPSLQTAEASGTITRVSLSDAIGAYEKDRLVLAGRSVGGGPCYTPALNGKGSPPFLLHRSPTSSSASPPRTTSRTAAWLFHYSSRFA